MHLYMYMWESASRACMHDCMEWHTCTTRPYCIKPYHITSNAMSNPARQI